MTYNWRNNLGHDFALNKERTMDERDIWIDFETIGDRLHSL